MAGWFSAWEKFSNITLAPVYSIYLNDDLSLMYAYCSWDHYSFIFKQMIDYSGPDWDEAFEFSAYDSTSHPFWASDFVTVWLSVLVRLLPYSIFELGDDTSCMRKGKQSGDYISYGECASNLVTTLFDSMLN